MQGCLPPGWGGLPLAQCPHPCPRPLRPASCPLPPGMPPLCTISPSPRCCPSVFACGVRCGVCAWTDIARVCSSRPVPTCEGPVVPCTSACVTSYYAASSAPSGADSRFAYVLVADAARCMLSPPSPAPLAPPPRPTGGCVFGPVCGLRMWCDDAWGRMLPHGSWWCEGGGGLWCPACEFHDGARCPTPHRR